MAPVGVDFSTIPDWFENEGKDSPGRRTDVRECRKEARWSELRAIESPVVKAAVLVLRRNFKAATVIKALGLVKASVYRAVKNLRQ